MRVLFVTGEFPPRQGGVGDCTNEIAKALATLGVEASVVTSSGPALERDAVPVRRVIGHWGWGIMPLLRRTIAETRAEIVHIQYQTAAFGMHPAINLAPRFLKSSSVRFVVTFHDLRVPYLFPKAGRLREWATFALARSCDAAVATNEADWARLSARLARPPALIPIGSNINPVPPEGYDRAAWREGRSVRQGETLLSYFGFLNESKGGETLVRALALSPECKLILIGGQTGASDPTNVAYLARIKRLIGELGLEARVLWTDYLPEPEVSAALLASDICVLPYRDGASFRRGTFMAALAHGLPIVTTRSPESPAAPSSSLPRLCDGENVLLVPPDQPPALASAIRRLASDDALRVRLSRGARETTAAFTWDKIAAAHIELYRAFGSNA